MPHSKKTIIEEKHDEDLVSRLPDDLLKYSLFRFLPSSALAQLGRTNQRLANFPECKEAKSVIEQLLAFIAHGEKDQAEALISQDPDLLLLEGRTRDDAGRKLQGTALGIALGAEDVNLYDTSGNLRGEGMVEMIHHYLRRLPDGEAEITRQTLKQFPAGWEEQEEKRHEGDLNALRKVREAIKISHNNKECKAALLEFKQHLAPQGIITTGRHWNAKLLLAAFEMGYKEHFHDCRKDNLFYHEVVGHIQSLAPANYAMAQAQGFRYLLENGENFKRNLKVRCSRGTHHYYPLSSSSFHLGSDFWVDCYFGAARDMSLSTHSLGAYTEAFFDTYVRAKTSVLRQFMPQSDNDAKATPRRKCCVVM